MKLREEMVCKRQKGVSQVIQIISWWKPTELSNIPSTQKIYKMKVSLKLQFSGTNLSRFPLCVCQISVSDKIELKCTKYIIKEYVCKCTEIKIPLNERSKQEGH